MIKESYFNEVEALDFLDISASIGRPPVPFTGIWAGKDNLLAEMKRSGIRQAATFHLLAKTYDANYGNSLLMEEIKDSPELIPVWVLVPSEEAMDCSPATFVERLVASGVRAVRMFPSSQSQPAIATRYAFSRWFYGDFIQELERRDIPVLLEFTPHRRSEPEWDSIYDLASEFPKLKIVLGDAFQRATWSLIRLMQACPNLYVQTSGLDVHRQLEYMVNQVGALRFVAGAKFPVATFGTMVGQVLFSRLSREQKKLIAGDNARRIMSLSCKREGI